MNSDDTKKHIRKLETEIEGLLIAIVREVASHQFYTDLIKKHKGTRAGDIFRELAGKETSHKEQLESKLSELQADLKELRRNKESNKAP
ncbi:MAG: ferritin family protein [Candidatus Hermodarchaeia archaeon]|jgi:rubrerythrin